MVLAFINAAIVLAIIAIYYKIKRHYTYWSRHGVKGPNLIQSLLSYTKILAFNDYEFWKKYGDIIGFYEIFKKAVIINDPELIKDILIKDFRVFTNRRYYYFGKIFDCSIVNSHDENWKRIRTIVGPSFTSSKLKLMTSTISEIGDQFCDNISEMAKKGLPFDIKFYVNAFTMDVLCSCAFGIQIQSIKDPNHPVVKNAVKAFAVDLSFSSILGYIAPSIANFFKLETLDRKAVEYFRELTQKIVEIRKTRSHSIDNKKTDFMQLMIDANQQILKENDTKNENKSEHTTNSSTTNLKTLTLDEITATAITFFFGGFDTTAATLSHFCYYIAKYPDVQEILHKEVSQLENFDDDSLAKAKYLNAVIAETLRLAPPGQRFDREASEDYELGNTGITLPKGTLVTLTGYTIHHNPTYFPNPFQFKPERFMSDEHNYNEFAYIPWGLGPRMCIGMRFAMNEMRIFVAKLIKKFRLRLAPNAKLNYFNGNFLFIPKEIMVYAEYRDQ